MELDLKAAPPTIELALPFGPHWTLNADNGTSVVKAGQAATLDDLKAHDQVKVLYIPGTRLIKSIEIEETASDTSNRSVSETAPSNASTGSR